MRFDIITVFPKIFDSYINESILKRAQEKKFITVRVHDLRKFTTDKHKKVDDRPYGGGAGMVLMVEPVLKAVDNITKGKKNNRQKIVVFSAKGKQFNQKIACQWAKKYNQIIFISGRYEGIDERVTTALHAEEISIGQYVLTDGDVAAMVVVSAITRLIPGVINLESLQEESHGDLLLKKGVKMATGKALEYPHYTRPEIFKYKGKKYHVPKVLLSGDHKNIENWRTLQIRGKEVK